jgi:hypothetical protein
MEEEFILLAYHKWLLRISNKDRIALAGLIYRDCLYDQNQMAFELLERTGDDKFSDETFLKAADLLLRADAR